MDGPFLIVSVAASRVPSLGIGAVLTHERVRAADGIDFFTTHIAFRVGQLRGNASVARRGDNTNADAIVLDLAKQLRGRMLAALRRR